MENSSTPAETVSPEKSQDDLLRDYFQAQSEPPEGWTPDDFSEGADGLFRICPRCGGAAEYPNCETCGFMFDGRTAGEQPPDTRTQENPDRAQYRLAVVAGQDKPHITRHELKTWPELQAWLSVPDVRASKDGPGWLAAEIEGWRNKDNAGAWQLFVLDVEAKTKTDKVTKIKRVVGPEPPPLVDTLAEAELCGLRSIGHTSYSHLDPTIEPADTEHHRYRMVFDVSRPVAPDEIKLLGLYLARRLGLADCIDEGTLEAARLFFLPACPSERQHKFEHGATEGQPLDVDALLADAARETAALEAARKAKQQRQSTARGSVIDAFNAAHDVGAVLEEHGYERRGRGRWLWPESSSRVPGVNLLPGSDPEHIYSHHGDPLNDGHAHDAFGVWLILRHQGQMRAAVREAAKRLGMDRKSDKPAVEFAELPDAPTDAQDAATAPPGTDTAPPPQTPETPAQGAQPGQQGQAKKPVIRFTPVRELLEQPEPLSWLIREFLLPAMQALLFGDPAVGKSLLGLAWAACIAMGREWRGRKVRQGTVIYLAGEGHHGIRRRLLAWGIANNCLDELREAPLFVSDAGADMTNAENLNAVVAVIDGISATAGTPALIVIDTLHRNIGAADENSAPDMAVYVKNCDALVQRYGCTVLTVHHSGHGDKSRSRGSSSIRGAMDAEYCMADDNGTRTLSATKMKDAPKPAPLAFELEQIRLPWLDDEGQHETSVVLADSEDHKSPGRKTVTPTQRLGFESLLTALDESGFPPPDHIAEALPSGAKLVSLESWRREFYARHMGDNHHAKKVAFQRVRNDLAKLGSIGHRDDVYWPVPGCGGIAELHGLLATREMLRDLQEAKNAA